MKVSLSNKTINHHHSLISAVLNKAAEWQVIKENVAKYIKPPKVIKTDIVFLNEEQVQILLNELKKRTTSTRGNDKAILTYGFKARGIMWT